MAEGNAARQIAQWVADHHQVLFRYAYRLSGSAADAEDLTQQTFLVAQQRMDQVRDQDCVRGWLFAILRSSFLKSRRKRAPVAAVDMDFDVQTIADNPPREPVDSQQLQAAIDELDDDFKIVVLLFYFEYRSYRSIAEVLEIPIGTVMSRLARAKGQLRRRLTLSDLAPPPMHGDSESTAPARALTRNSPY